MTLEHGIMALKAIPALGGEMAGREKEPQVQQALLLGDPTNLDGLLPVALPHPGEHNSLGMDPRAPLPGGPTRTWGRARARASGRVFDESLLKSLKNLLDTSTG